MLQVLAFDTTGKLLPGLGGERCAVVGIDLASGYAKIDFLRRKSGAAHFVKRIVQEAEREHCQDYLLVEIVRTDNGSEYVNTALDDWLDKRGIQHQTTVTYSPEQNGVVERHWQTLYGWARCILLESGRDEQLWPYALDYVNTVYNYLPRADGAPLPHQAYYGALPDVQTLRGWGCRAWAHLPKELRESKFEARAVECIFIGFSPSTKGYLMLAPDGQVFLTHAATFDEKTPAKIVTKDLLLTRSKDVPPRSRRG